MTALAFSIRPYDPADAPEMARLYFDSAREIGARRYSAEQVAAWAPVPVDPEVVRRRAADGRMTWVAAGADGAVLGYCDLEPDGHVDHLYCRPDAAGKGVASALLDALLDGARAAGMPRLYVEASELARGLFARKGFTVERRRDFEVRGVAIHNYAMERRL
ncbi:GNAT family N-acetyltransferase [Phenylobacterium sp. VNQ135]|uniref:GNAT family N-acetyltransferase n=1 Tax=Phenylobacterium sp. VNQ135 TaxID=3400922 RepID=UPI003C005527